MEKQVETQRSWELVEVGPPQAEATPKEQIERALQTEDPIGTLREICHGIPHFLTPKEALRLRRSGQDDELVYRCLPTLLGHLEQLGNFGVDTKDLLEEGLIALQESIKAWDPKIKTRSGRPLPLRAFAGRYMRWRMTSFIAEQYGLSQNEFPIVRLYREYWQEFVDEEDRPPTLDELIRLTRLRTKESLPPGLKLEKVRIAKLTQMYNTTQLQPLTQAIKEARISSPEEVVEQELLREAIVDVLAGLSDRERKILELRFGLIDGFPSDPEEVGEEFGVTKERVRQIEAKAFRELRHPIRARQLRDFYGEPGKAKRRRPKEVVEPVTFERIKDWIEKPERREAFFNVLRKYAGFIERVYGVSLHSASGRYSGEAMCEPTAHALGHAIKEKFRLSPNDVMVVKGWYKDLRAPDGGPHDAWVRARIGDKKYFFHPTLGQFDERWVGKIALGDLEEEGQLGLRANEASEYPEGFEARLTNISEEEGGVGQLYYENLYLSLMKDYPRRAPKPPQSLVPAQLE